MLAKKAFTLVELMVVVLIVSILAAVAVAMLTGRSDSAKCSEGKAIAGSLAKAIRVYAAEKGVAGFYGAGAPSLVMLGVSTGELRGKYFSSGDYSWTTSYNAAADPALTYTLTITTPAGIRTPSQITLDSNGQWIEIP